MIVEPSWSFARVRVSRGEGMAPGAARLVLQGVYEGSDEATIAAAMTDHMLEELRRHALHGQVKGAQSEGAGVHIRITIEWLPDLLDVPEAGDEPASGEAPPQRRSGPFTACAAWTLRSRSRPIYTKR